MVYTCALTSRQVSVPALYFLMTPDGIEGEVVVVMAIIWTIRSDITVKSF